jgi:hypothetical protein
MAVDTEDKRRSVLTVLPIPNADVDAGDREQVAWLYRGIPAAPPLAQPMIIRFRAFAGPLES